MKDATKELEKIEYKNRTWRSDIMRNNSIWEAIAVEINSHKGKEQKFWIEVMDLHNSKKFTTTFKKNSYESKQNENINALNYCEN